MAKAIAMPLSPLSALKNVSHCISDIVATSDIDMPSLSTVSASKADTLVNPLLPKVK